MKYLALLLLLPMLATAQTATPDCTLAWDYEVEDESRIDGFRLYANDAEVVVVEPDKRQVTCADAGLSEGTHSVHLKAFNAVDESGPSNTLSLTFVTAPPTPPTMLHIVILP